MRMQQYFVDIRISCVAVRDRQETDPEYDELHDDTLGVVRFWGFRRLLGRCPTCNSSRPHWEYGVKEIAAAKELVAELNAAETKKKGDAP